MGKYTEDSWAFAREKHKGQKDDMGEDYFESHIVPVYNILCSAGIGNHEILSAALLHDTLEDTDTTYIELLDNFGYKVANLVNEVTHEGQKDEFGFYFPRLKSKEAILIKFADRLSNLFRMDNWDVGRQEHYLKRSKFWKSERKKGS